MTKSAWLRGTWGCAPSGACTRTSSCESPYILKWLKTFLKPEQLLHVSVASSSKDGPSLYSSALSTRAAIWYDKWIGPNKAKQHPCQCSAFGFLDFCPAPKKKVVDAAESHGVAGIHLGQLLVQHFAHVGDVEPECSDERRAAARQARANIGWANSSGNYALGSLACMRCRRGIAWPNSKCCQL